MQIIIDYMSDHNVTAVVRNYDENRIDVIGGVTYYCDFGSLEEYVKRSDIVFTWASAAPETARLCVKHKTPYVLLIRWFRLIQPLPPGDMMQRRIDRSFVDEHRFIFDNAKEIITNNNYSADVVERYYGRRPLVSYVPVTGRKRSMGKKEGHLLFISPHRGLGEAPIIREIAKKLDKKIVAVNCNARNEIELEGVDVGVVGYVEDMDTHWKNCSIFCMPVYKNDVCGTTRAVIEAMQRGIPVIANDRCGIGEKVPNLVGRDASVGDWITKIKAIEARYDDFVKDAHRVWDAYNTDNQLKIFKRCLKK